MEPIAIIGFGFKFPQDITNAESLWKLLMERRSTMTEIPNNRWNIDGYYKDHGHRPGTVKNRGGHFLADDPARFDAPFFSIQPAEAECMDPQQRLLLETSYHALENAGIPMQSAMGTRTSVHVGCLLQEYSQISQRDSQMPGDYRIVGSSGLAMLANRLSWFYDFSGPSMTVDTACSGGLVAFHLACQELLAGSVNMSLVCGNNLCLLPDSTALLSSLNMMSKDSVCYSFDERASGYARGEGFGCLILKRLSQAIADGDTIRGVVRSTGVGQDGNTPSITSPSQTAQERLIRETYARAGLELDKTRYFEAHGTGTPVGDPCEAAAINNVFSTRTPDDPMFVGALKSNMGHPEGASGIAGVIKTLLVLEKGIVPPNVYPERINPAVAAAGPNLKFPLEAVAWPKGGVRRASINSFGYGGTNAHVVIDDALSFLKERGLKARHCTRGLPRIEEASATDVEIADSASCDEASYDTPASDSCSNIEDGEGIPTIGVRKSKILVLSAFDERALSRYTLALEAWMRGQVKKVDLNALAYTLSEKRTSFPWKSFAVTSANSNSQLSWSAPVRVKPRVTISFVFTGQGAQWHGMGRELMEREIFRSSMMEADQYFKSLGSRWSLIGKPAGPVLREQSLTLTDELYNKPKSESAIHQPELSQPICTALQVAIVDLLSSWNVHASVSVGHSSGEIASAYTSGALSRKSAWMVAYFRGLAVSITQDLCESVSAGAMIAVQAPIDSWMSLMEEHNTTSSSDNQVAIACYNSPYSFTLSGPRDSIVRMSATLVDAGVEVHILKIDVAYHSQHMEPVAKVYRKLLRQIEPGPHSDAHPHFVSTVTGKLMKDVSALRTAEYWNRNLTGSVKFSAALQTISDRQDRSTAADFLIEIGPHSVLRSPTRDILKISGRDIATDYTSVMRRNLPADTTALECAGKVLTAGVAVDIARMNKYANSTAKLLTSLPSYQFEDKKKYWLEGRTSIQYRQNKFVHHELLGLRTPDWNEHEARWTNRILLDQSPYLRDHVINGLCLMPAAGMLSMAIEAVRQFYGEKTDVQASGYTLRDVAFTKAMTLSADTRGTEIQLTLRTTNDGASWDHFSLYVYEDDHWHLCCAGSIKVEYSPYEAFDEKTRALFAGLRNCRTVIPSSDIYEAFNKAELAYGPTFKGMKNVTWNPDGQAAGTVTLHGWEANAYHRSDPHFIHPAALDSILQMAFPAHSIYAKNASATTLPTGFNNAWFSADLANSNSTSDSDALVHAKVVGRGFRNKLFAVTAAMADSKELCFYGELETTTIGRSGSPGKEKEVPRSLYRIDWQPADFGRVANEATLAGESRSTVHVIYDETSSLQVDLVRCLSEQFLWQDGLGTVLVPWQSALDYSLTKSLCIFLPGLNGSLLRHMGVEDLEKIKTLISAVDALIWITFQHSELHQNPTEGLVSGLVRTLATESEDYRLVSLSLDAKLGLDAASANIVKVASTFLEHVTDPEDEFCEINGKLCIPRVIDDGELTAKVLPGEQTTSTVRKPWVELECLKLTIGAAGILNTLHYEQVHLETAELGPDEVLVEIKAVGLNSRDLLVALGQVHDEAFGSEIAGVVLQIGTLPTHDLQVGDRVFGVARDAVAKTVRCSSLRLQKIPQDMGFTSAAAYPVAYCTAYYSLVHLGRVQKNESVLIQHGAGVLGQAAIQIALQHGCNVFATVGSTKENITLCGLYGIPDSHLLLNVGLDLADTIRRFTSGRGVDVVLNQSEAAVEAWACIAPFGRFVEVIEKDAFVSTANGLKQTNMPINTKNVTFASINFEELSCSDLFANIFHEVVEMMKDWLLTTIKPVVVFSQNDVEAAFRALQGESHVGKVVVEMRHEQMVEMELAADSKLLFREDASYLVAGAFGGIGQDITRWMVQNGARHLVLPSRCAVDGTGSDRERFVQGLRAQGAVAKTPVCDIAKESQMSNMLQQLGDIPPIRGCIQAAMVMQDSAFANMTIDKWHSSLAPKADGSWNLHHLLPSNLDFFVMLSSSAGIMGAFGQSNYAAGNTYQDTLASHRTSRGQRAHTLALGMVTGVGYVAQNEQVQALLRVRGVLDEVSMRDIHALLRYCCNPQRVDASSCGSQIITPLTLPADLRATGIVAPLGSTRPIYSYIDTLPSRFSSDTLSAEAKNRPSHRLGEATSMVQAIETVTDAIQTQLSNLLVVSKEDIDTQKAIYRYGVDSLVAVEMRNWFAKAVGADVSTVDVMSDISIWLLAVKVAAKSMFVRDEVKEA